MALRFYAFLVGLLYRIIRFFCPRFLVAKVKMLFNQDSGVDQIHIYYKLTPFPAYLIELSVIKHNRTHNKIWSIEIDRTFD